MAKPNTFDWQNSSNADRRELFRAYRSIFTDARSLREAIEAALEKSVGDKYADNFSRGISARRDCPDLLKYLAEHHPAAAEELMRKLKPGLLSPWEAYYRKHRVDNRLAVALYVNHASPLFREPPGIERLFYDDHFYLQIDSQIDGVALGYWKTGGYWFRLSVGPTAVTPGRQWITRDEKRDDPISNIIFGGPSGTGEIRPIRYNGRDRLPELVVIVADQPTVDALSELDGKLDMPMRERALDMFPSILETSKSPWAISWVAPSFVSSDGWGGGRSE